MKKTKINVNDEVKMIMITVIKSQRCVSYNIETFCLENTINSEKNTDLYTYNICKNH